jgi:hypothetical protein
MHVRPCMSLTLTATLLLSTQCHSSLFCTDIVDFALDSAFLLSRVSCFNCSLFRNVISQKQYQRSRCVFRWCSICTCLNSNLKIRWQQLFWYAFYFGFPFLYMEDRSRERFPLYGNQLRNVDNAALLYNMINLILPQPYSLAIICSIQPSAWESNSSCIRSVLITRRAIYKSNVSTRFFASLV